MILVRHGQSTFNVAFERTRRDPGIRDPELTGTGRRQAAMAAAKLAGHGIRRLIASPYRRALQTAGIIAARLDLPIAVEPLVGEWALFACDIGSHRAELERDWPQLEFAHLADAWWPAESESEAALLDRCTRFRAAMAASPDWSATAVVTHWGVIRALTGREVGNGDLVRFDPAGDGLAAAIEQDGDPW